MTRADDELSATLDRLEKRMPTMSPEELELTSELLAEMRKQKTRTLSRLELINEAIEGDWGKTRILSLFRSLYPRKLGAKKSGTKVPEAYFLKITSRCPPEPVTSVAREIVEREESWGNLTGEARQKAIKNRADYVARLFSERKKSE